MVGRVEVLTVPAAREENLSSEAARAVSVGKSRGLRCRGPVEVDADAESVPVTTEVHIKETDQFQVMALDSGVFALLRAYGLPASMRRPSGKACTVSLKPERWR